MKLGGITWWRNNYGSILQALALQKFLQEYKNIDYEIICQYSRNPNSSKNFFLNLKKNGIKKTIIKTFWRVFFKKLKTRNHILQKFVNDNLKISEIEIDFNKKEDLQILDNKYDGFICGSDQIWNPALTNYSDYYWINFTNKKKIAYAPSIGVEDVSEINNTKYISDALSTFTSISCREESGTDVINEILINNNVNKKCFNVVDPTLLIDKNYWVDNTVENNEKYIFTYILRGNKKQRKEIEKFSKITNLDIYTMPFLESENACFYDLFFGNKKIYNASPFDFISYIRNAEYIFTDSFHCVIFSILFHKKFYLFPKKGAKQMARLNAIMKLFNIDSRIINNIDDIKNIKDIDWEEVDRLLNKKQSESREYLNNAIGG